MLESSWFLHWRMVHYSGSVERLSGGAPQAAIGPILDLAKDILGIVGEIND